MADDIDMTPSSDTPSGATAPPPDPSTTAQAQPDVSADEAKADIGELQKENKSVSDYLNRIAQHEATSSQYNQDQITEMQKSFNDLRSQPDEPPPQMPQVQPLNERQKGGLSETIFQILKFSALMGLAYGVAGRGHGAIAKAAIGGALEGWATGQKNQQDTMLKTWEKNNELALKQFTERNQIWHDIMADKHLKLQESMDLLKFTSERWQNDRMSTAAEEKNVMDAHKTYYDNVRLLNHYKDVIRKAKFNLSDVLNKSKDKTEREYENRAVAKFREKNGRTPSSQEEWDKALNDYPLSTYLDDAAKEEGKREYLKQQAKDQANEEAKAKEKSDKQHMAHPGAVPGNRLGLNLD